MPRPTVKKITVEIEWEGNTSTETITDLPEAIFFGDQGVYEILTPFYNGKTILMTKDEARNNWGDNIADKIFGAAEPGTASKKIDQQFIHDLWNTPKDAAADELLYMVRKLPECPIK